MTNEEIFDATKKDIGEIVAQAQSIVAPMIAPAQDIIKDIKLQISHGTDRISTSVIQSWALSLAVINTELTPFKDAYSLTSGLWKVDIAKSNAQNLASRRAEQKKTELENQNVIDSADKETQKIILDYMSTVISDMQDGISKMLSELNRVLDARTRNGEKV